MAYYYKERKRNTPLVTLIKNYTNKESGKVIASRKEIQRRFDYLDWKDQKKIIAAFLDSSKTDRQWAYSKMLYYWDKSFELKVKKLWEQLHEIKCSWVVIRHFPLEYIFQHRDEFTEDRDNYFICLRQAKNKDFVIDKDKLSFTDYLGVLYHTGRTITDEEAEEVLYKIVHKLCVDDLTMQKELKHNTKIYKDTIFSPIECHDINLAFYYLIRLNCTDAVCRFEEWNDEVMNDIYNSSEFKALSQADLWDNYYMERKIKITRKYAYLALDDKYKKPSDPDIEEILQPKACLVENKNASKEPTNLAPRSSSPVDFATLEKMMARNPAIKKMVDIFELDIY